MRGKMYMVTGALACATVVLSASLVAQDRDQYPEMSEEQKAMMEAWGKYMTPGVQHERLTSRAGTWDVAMKIWHAPGTDPEMSEGKSTIKAVMDGRYIVEKFECEMQDQPFSGMGICGYDNIKQKYVSVWIDNMMTGILQSVGEEKSNGNLEFIGQHPDPLRNRYDKMRMVEKKSSHDKFLFSAYTTAEDGSEFKMMEFVYSRAD